MFYAMQSGRIDLSHARAMGTDTSDPETAALTAERILSIREDAFNLKVVALIVDHDGEQHTKFEAGYIAVLARLDAPYTDIERPGLFRFPVTEEQAHNIIRSKQADGTPVATYIPESACGVCHPEKRIGA